VTQAVDGRVDRAFARAQANATNSVLATPQNVRLEFVLTKDQYLTGPHLASGMHQALPNVVSFPLGEQQFGLTGQKLTGSGIVLANLLRRRPAPPAEQARRKDPGVVKDQQVARLEDLWEVTERAVLKRSRGAVERHHARGVAFRERPLRDQFGRKRVVKFREKHSPAFYDEMPRFALWRLIFRGSISRACDRFLHVNSPSATITARGIERITSGHLWIYRADVADASGAAPGDVVRVLDRKKHFWGQALYSSKSQITLRMLTRESRPFDRTFLAERIRAAAAYRERVAEGAHAYRLVAGEGDLLPSLIIDRYAQCFVVQTLSQGMDRLKPIVVEILTEQFAPLSILERNDAAVRGLEGLPEQVGILAGEDIGEVVVEEGGVKFAYDLRRGQKTGGFLDQRENRAAARQYARGRLLDCFTYSGGFAIALADQCESVLGVEASGEALKLARRNQELNNLTNIEWLEANCFDFLKAADQEGRRFDMVVLDPPAFARQKSSRESALRGYKELNLRALKILNPGGYLVTCSCSFHVSEADLLETIASAALDAHRAVAVVERRTQSRDHPILLTVPETHYLKCLILRVL